jgi:membrane protease YdiL (CAAX protease family)
MAPPAVLVLLPAILVPALLIAIPSSIWPAVIAYHAYCLSVSFGWPDERPARPLRAGSRGGRAVLLIALALLLAGEVAARYGLVTIDMLPDGWRGIAERAMPWPAFAIYSLAVNGYVEERFWRGALLDRTGVRRGAAAFGLLHAAAMGVLLGLPAALPAALAAGAITGIAGLFWGWLRRESGTLWPCVITHIAADAAILRVAWTLLAS